MKHSIDIQCGLRQGLVSDKVSTSMTPCPSITSSLKEESDFSQPVCSKKADHFRQVIQTCRALLQKQGVHSTMSMTAAGFNYTGNGDTVHCDTCELEVSEWTLYMKPFTIHAQRSPKCAFVRSLMPNGIAPAPSKMNLLATTSALMDDEKPSKRQKNEATEEITQPYRLLKIDILKQIRKRTFSNWPHKTSPSNDDFVSDSDLLVACMILQKHIEHINGKKENIIIPNVKVNQIHEREQAKLRSSTNILSRTQSHNLLGNMTHEISLTNSRNNTVAEMTTSSQHIRRAMNVNDQQVAPQPSSSLCTVCLKEEKRLVCVPCGHLVMYSLWSLSSIMSDM
ncbi:unnamed protein product [Rotaria sp. Silwood1]|nr:unnamed protein product [Rotaria sp. Silwood1]